MSRRNRCSLQLILMMMTVFLFGEMCLAQDNLTDIFLRKAVKEFVAKQYDKAINDLDQALTADPENTKAKKLLAKCRERKAGELLATGDIEGAKNSYLMALQNDSAHAEAKAGLAKIQQMSVPQPLAEPPRSARAQPEQKESFQQQHSPQPSIIVNQATSNGKADSVQAELIAQMMANFQQQQQIMAQQLASSSELMKSTDAQKERYLEALIKSSEQKSGMMREFIVVGAVVVLVVIIIALIVFVFIFSKYSRASELRTIQATEALQALMASQDIKQLASQEARLMLAGPDAKPAAGAAPASAVPYPENATVKDGMLGVSIGALSDSDPAVRAKNIELLELELSNGGTGKPENAPKIAKLREMLTDANNRVRANAAKAFFLVEPEVALDNLREMLRDVSSRSRASALWSLGEIGSKKALDMIMEMSEEDDEIVCYNIRMALEKIVSRKTCEIDESLRLRMNSLIEQYAEAM